VLSAAGLDEPVGCAGETSGFRVCCLPASFLAGVRCVPPFGIPHSGTSPFGGEIAMRKVFAFVEEL